MISLIAIQERISPLYKWNYLDIYSLHSILNNTSIYELRYLKEYPSVPQKELIRGTINANYSSPFASLYSRPRLTEKVIENKFEPLFYYGANNLFHPLVKSDKTININMSKVKSLYQTNTLSTRLIIEQSQPIFSDLRCPFNSTTSLVTLKRKTVCDKNNPIERTVESVFEIGSQHYHQVAQHFYVFDDFIYPLEANKVNKVKKVKKVKELGTYALRFAYDKYVSNLFNDYFGIN